MIEKVKRKSMVIRPSGRSTDYLESNPDAEKHLWVPGIQENKISQYGGTNIRYISTLKARYIEEFRKLHASVIPWNTIRYIF